MIDAIKLAEFFRTGNIAYYSKSVAFLVELGCDDYGGGFPFPKCTSEQKQMHRALILTLLAEVARDEGL